MADTNKIEYGLEQIYFAPLTKETGPDGTETYTYGTPVALVGAKSMSLSPEGDQAVIYADNSAWFTSTTNNGYSGNLSFIHFSDEIRETIYKNVKASNGTLLERADVQPAEGALLWQCLGDAKNVRHVLYDVKFGNPSVDIATKEDGIEATEVSMDYTATPIRLSNGALVTKGKITEGDTGYASFFTTCSVPTISTSPQSE